VALTVRLLIEHLQKLHEQDAEIKVRDHTGFVGSSAQDKLYNIYLSKTEWWHEINCYTLMIDGDRDDYGAWRKQK